jgi:hypothetical protein
MENLSLVTHRQSGSLGELEANLGARLAFMGSAAIFSCGASQEQTTNRR